MSNRESAAQKLYMQKQLRRRHRITVIRILLFLGVLILWEAGAQSGAINDFIFSSPLRIVNCFYSMVTDKTIFYHVGITILETVISFCLVLGIGIGGAVLLWMNRNLYEILDPYLVIMNSLPKSALAPILIVWLGANMKTIIVAAVSVAVFGTVLTLHNGFENMDGDQIKLIYVLGGNRKDALLKVLLPGSVPLIISNMKVNVGLCLVGVIIGEFLAARAGLGYLIIYGSQVFKLDLVMMSIAILCVLSALLYKGISLVEKGIKH